MITTLLTSDEVLAGFDRISPLYPFIPSLCMWRAWEIAAYRRLTLSEPVLDIGCGDGAFFRLAWPMVRDVSGVDMDRAMVELARASGIYREVFLSAAQRLPTPSGAFGSAFANCSVEHMDDPAIVFGEIYRSLKPGGEFIFSIVTDQLIPWNPLPILAGRFGADASKVADAYRDYHHYGNPPAAEEWMGIAESAGFKVMEHIPIMPEVMSRACLFIDSLWHLGAPGPELGGEVQSYLAQYPKFPQAMRHFMQGLFAMEQNPSRCGGAVLRVGKVVN